MNVNNKKYENNPRYKIIFELDKNCVIDEEQIFFIDPKNIKR